MIERSVMEELQASVDELADLLQDARERVRRMRADRDRWVRFARALDRRRSAEAVNRWPYSLHRFQPRWAVEPGDWSLTLVGIAWLAAAVAGVLAP